MPLSSPEKVGRGFFMPPYAQRIGWSSLVAFIVYRSSRSAWTASAWAAYSTGEKEAVSVMSSLTVSVREVLVFPSLQERN